MILVGAVGNMLVIIAIATEKALKGIQNWFIASLAVADFMVGLIIMPFSLAQELMGYWLFGELWCSLHAAIDVLACTSSINNICLISLDRYWSITQAVDYLKSRTPRRAIFMIAFVWLFSALICFPPLLGWRKKRVQSDFPKCEVSATAVSSPPQPLARVRGVSRSSGALAASKDHHPAGSGHGREAGADPATGGRTWEAYRPAGGIGAGTCRSRWPDCGRDAVRAACDMEPAG